MYAVAVDPENPLVAFAVGTGGVFKTENGGNRWVHFMPTSLARGCPERGPFLSVALSPSDVTQVFVAQYGGPDSKRFVGIYESPDGGAHWTFNRALGHVAAREIFMHPAAPDLVYVGYQGGAARSTDGGKSWTKVCPTQCQRRVRLAIDPMDPDTVYVATARGAFGLTVGRFHRGEGAFLFKSTDGGGSWRQLTQFTPRLMGPGEYISAMVVDPARPSTMFLGTNVEYGVGARPRILETADGGRTWSAVPDPTQHGAVTTLAVDPGGHFLFVARQFGAGIARLPIGDDGLI
jgi:photosystem II stability/assembly factor-like uncharacterized protein